jgi:hypothetical protein
LTLKFSQYYQDQVIKKTSNLMGRSIRSQAERQEFLARSKIIFDFGNKIQVEVQQPSHKITVSGLKKQRYTNVHILWQYQGGRKVRFLVAELVPIEIAVSEG